MKLMILSAAERQTLTKTRRPTSSPEMTCESSSIAVVAIVAVPAVVAVISVARVIRAFSVTF
jgi:hypothetical protein